MLEVLFAGLDVGLNSNWSLFWVALHCRLPQQLWETLERCGRNLKPILRPKIVSKIGLSLNAKALSEISRLSISQSCYSRLEFKSMQYFGKF
ncbi:hypothetical protein [Companilactobacillus sp. HBUAS56257]|uniref:hypothetical protein n=1 Tax=Companilactobacillus sp. HBUAS56257 TaxID=3109360 RepID=UPI002FEFD2A5